MFPHSTNPSHLFQSVRGRVFSWANVVVLLLKYVCVSPHSQRPGSNSVDRDLAVHEMTECAALCSSRQRYQTIKNSQISSALTYRFSDALVSEGSSKHPKPTRRLHLLCGLVVAGTGHVGNIGRYGLDLPHELISNPAVVLQQCHEALEGCRL